MSDPLNLGKGVKKFKKAFEGINSVTKTDDSTPGQVIKKLSNYTPRQVAHNVESTVANAPLVKAAGDGIDSAAKSVSKRAGKFAKKLGL